MAPSPAYGVFREVVRDYPGVLSATEDLLRELTKTPVDWATVVTELRAYALKNFSLYTRHEQGMDAVRAIIEGFLGALESADRSVQVASLDSLVFYLEKILLDGDGDLRRYVPVLQDSFAKLNRLPEGQFLFITIGPHQVKKLGVLLAQKMLPGLHLAGFNDLLVRTLLTTYEYWLEQEDPARWLTEGARLSLSEAEIGQLKELFAPVCHENLESLLSRVTALETTTDHYGRLRELLELPSHLQLVRFYEDLAGKLVQAGKEALKLAYLLKVMECEALAGIHEGALRDIARTLTLIMRDQEAEEIRVLLSDTFDTFRRSVARYPETTLNCIQTIGDVIYVSGDSHLVEFFIERVVSLGFQHPKVKGVTDEWQLKVNRGHLKNVRVWLGLIENNPKWSKALISALIINLRLGGVQINDTDVFQKDVTGLLNSDMRPVYHFIKQLAKIFPVYFSDINAEGALREVSTAIDDATERRDPLVHFLRKQTHVECSARVVDFMEETFRFWLTRDKLPLERFLPEDRYHQLETCGEFVDDLHTIFTVLLRDERIKSVGDLLGLSDEEGRTLIEDVPAVSEREKERAFLALRFYRVLHQKYTFSSEDIKDQLHYASHIGLPNPDPLIAALDRGNLTQRLRAILDYLELLKDIVLSPEQYEAVEDIFRKRHIAAGIPSLYGRYIEKKFNALALTFRLENLANLCFEEIVNSVNLSYVTRATLFEIKKYAGLFYRALSIDGISSNRLEMNLELLSDALEVRRFSFSQYIDIFRGLSEAVQDILNTYYHGFHKNSLRQIIPLMGRDNILPKYLSSHHAEGAFELVHTISEQFLREVVTASFGLQQLDVFFTRILKTLFMQAGDLDVQTLDLLMSYDAKKALSSLHTPNRITHDRIHLGTKGYNLVKLAELGVQVPPGFIVTTEVFRCHDAITKFRFAQDHLSECIRKSIADLEAQTGRKFGDPDNPLLVSVRSGSTISMPGMMSSLLNVGLNETTLDGLIKQTDKPWFAWDCYRRFLQSWAMSFDIDRDAFDATIRSFKEKYGVEEKINFTPGQMRDVAMGYRSLINKSRIPLFDEPEQQLETAIAQVLLSWFSEKAKAYREILGISDHWGTAAIVQAMVYGNLDARSGTGVLFTTNPRTTSDRVTLWGDFAVSAQGEDIVSGLVKTWPLSKEQKESEERTRERSPGEKSLEEEFPEIYDSLLRMSKDLIYERRWGAQEIEFTFEGDKRENLYILQTRDMSLLRKESFFAFVPTPELSESYLVSGIGAGGGVLSGRVVFDLEDIRGFRKREPEMPLILIRSDTVPDDIRHITAADGLLTARGGATSHASIIANRLGKTCVVGCNKISVREHEKRCTINGKTIALGDLLSINGRNGSVYLGMHEITEIKQ